MLKGSLLVAQGGGPTAVINQSLVGVVLAAMEYDCIDKIYGSWHGVEGIKNGTLADLTNVSKEHLEQVAETTGSAMLSTRVRPDKEYCKKMFENMKKLNIRYFFYVGGNDSSDTVRIVSEYAEQEGYDLRAVHIPKTIDNDLVLSDHTPGYASAAKYVAYAFMGADFDNRALAGVYIGVIMGRHAGFLTGAAALGRANSEAGPHLLYFPERAFDLDDFVRDVKACYEKYGRCVIAVSEGISDKDGTPIVTKLASESEKDQHGNVQLSGTGALGDYLANYIKENTGISRVRADTLGYMQRAFSAAVSDVDAMEARAAGEFGVHVALGASSDSEEMRSSLEVRSKSSEETSVVITSQEIPRSFSVGIERAGDAPYESRMFVTEIANIAAKTRLMPKSFINEAGNNVTEKFVKYAEPLLGEDFKKGTPLVAPEVNIK